MEELLAFSRLEVYSIAIVILLLGPGVFTATLNAITSMKWLCKLGLLCSEYLIVFNVVYLMFEDLSVLEGEPVVYAYTVASSCLASLAWDRLSIKQKRWWKGASILLAVVIGTIIAVQLYYDINFFMAAGLLWRRVFVRLFARMRMRALSMLKGVLELLRFFWKIALEFFATMSWVTFRRILGRSSLQVGIRWTKKILILSVIYVFVARKARKLFMNQKIQQLKEVIGRNKERAQNLYKNLKFRYKLAFCIGATIATLFVGDAYEFFYPFLPKAFMVKLIGLVKVIGAGITFLLKKLGIHGLIDQTTKKVSQKILGRMSEDARQKWERYKKWRLGRMVIHIDRWIMILDRPARKKARDMRIAAAEKIFCAKKTVQDVTEAVGSTVRKVIPIVIPTPKVALDGLMKTQRMIIKKIKNR